MNVFVLLTMLFIAVSVAMILIILVQRPQGGGLAGAFGGAGGAGSDSVFGGRVGDALTWATTIAFVVYLLLAVSINLVPMTRTATPPANTQPVVETNETGAGAGAGAPATPPAAGDETDGAATPPAAPAPAPAPAPGDGTAGDGDGEGTGE